MLRQISFVARLGASKVRIKFVGFRRPAASVILGCDFCGSHAESIFVQRKDVELLDASRVPIVRKPPKRDPDAVPLLLPKKYREVSRRGLVKLRAEKRAVIPAVSQPFVQVMTEPSRLSVLEPSSRLCEMHFLALANGLV